MVSMLYRALETCKNCFKKFLKNFIRKRMPFPSSISPGDSMKTNAAAAILFCLFVIFAFSFPAVAEPVIFDSGPPYEMEIFQNADRSGLTLDMKINSVAISDERVSQGLFANVSLDGSAYSGEIGLPRIPVLRRFVLLPAGAKVGISSSGNSRIFDLEDYSEARYLMPVQPGEEKCGCPTAALPFVFNQESFSSDAYRFIENVEIIETGVFRGRDFIVIEIRPVDYNPISHTLKLFSDMRVNISFSDADWDAAMEKANRYGDYRSTAMLDISFINPEYLATKTNVDYIAPSSYLVIGLSNFITSDVFSDWVNWKRSKGYKVELADLNEAGATSSQIRNYITNAYNTWDVPPGFVLLVGDTNTIPHFVGNGGQSPATDLYYAAIDGGDLFADLGIGRFSARNLVQLERMVNKTLDYEFGNWKSDVWLNMATFMASRDRSWITQGSHDAVCTNIFEPEGFVCEKYYNKQGATTSQVLSAINSGTAFLTYSGHGEVTGWVDGPPVTASQVTNLNNSVYPFVSSFACLTGKFQADECFAETWQRAKSGSVAMYASSVSSTWDEDDILERGMMWGLFYGSQTFELKEEPDFLEIPWFSGFTDYAKHVLFEWAAGGGTTTMYFEMYNLFGDPETMAWTSYPKNIEVKHKTEISVPATNINIEVSGDFVFAKVGVSSGNTLLGTALIKPGTKTAVPLLTEVTKDMDALLVVSGHNFLPYQKEITFTNDPGAGPDDDGDDDDIFDDDDDDDKGPSSDLDNSGDDGDTGGCGC